MKIRNIGFGMLVVMLALCIGLCVSQMGRNPLRIISRVNATDSTEETDCREVLGDSEVLPADTERTLYIGTLRDCEPGAAGRNSEVDYFCLPEMTVLNLWEQRISDENFSQTTLEELLAEREYARVIVALGLNDAGCSLTRLRCEFEELIQRLLRTQPQAEIYIQGAPVFDGDNHIVAVDRAARQRVQKINGMLREIAGLYRVNFLDIHREFADNQKLGRGGWYKVPVWAYGYIATYKIRS